MADRYQKKMQQDLAYGFTDAPVIWQLKEKEPMDYWPDI